MQKRGAGIVAGEGGEVSRTGYKQTSIVRGVPHGAPGSWTWLELPFEHDRTAQAFVRLHPNGASLEEVGDAMGMTRERVRQIEAIALRKMRRRSKLDVAALEALVRRGRV